MERGRRGLPRVSDDDVVEGFVAFAEAGETDFEDHCLLALKLGRVMLLCCAFGLGFDRAEKGR